MCYLGRYPKGDNESSVVITMEWAHLIVGG
jgi:hypothetical protein